ncbi:MAG: haloacid dehalogenase-like hydrolase [Bacteroidia bacterium]|nr:haloacid dehalogenase-like hydrolase [Bacteroidia bacterium]
MSRLFISDVCNTLFDSNTSMDFVHYVAAQRGEEYLSKYEWIHQRISPLYWVHAVAHQLTGAEWGRDWSLKLLKGLKQTELSDLARDFTQNYLFRKKVFHKTHRKLIEAIQIGEIVVLASAGIRPVISAIADEFGIQFVCSELEYDEQEICTGKLARDLTGQKLAALAPWLHEKPHITVMSDNFSDKPLFDKAHRKIVVINKPKDLARWQKMPAEYLLLYSKD